MIVPGHGLQREGAPYEANGFLSRDGSGRGKCRCGALSEPFSTTAARKRWHVQHKADVAAARKQAAS